MVDLEQLYKKIDTKLSDNRPKEDKLHQKAQERLSVLYSEFIHSPHVMPFSY